jgi:hypothetical protein
VELSGGCGKSLEALPNALHELATFLAKSQNTRNLQKIVKDPAGRARSERDHRATGHDAGAFGERAGADCTYLAVGLSDDQVWRQLDKPLRVDFVEGLAGGQARTNSRVDIGARARSVEGRTTYARQTLHPAWVVAFVRSSDESIARA